MNHATRICVLLGQRGLNRYLAMLHVVEEHESFLQLVFTMEVLPLYVTVRIKTNVPIPS